MEGYWASKLCKKTEAHIRKNELVYFLAYFDGIASLPMHPKEMIPLHDKHVTTSSLTGTIPSPFHNFSLWYPSSPLEHASLQVGWYQQSCWLGTLVDLTVWCSSLETGIHNTELYIWEGEKIMWWIILLSTVQYNALPSMYYGYGKKKWGLQRGREMHNSDTIKNSFMYFYSRNVTS